MKKKHFDITEKHTDWKSHREAWEQTREINMDLNEIEGRRKNDLFETVMLAIAHIAIVAAICFIFFQVIRAL